MQAGRQLRDCLTFYLGELSQRCQNKQQPGQGKRERPGWGWLWNHRLGVLGGKDIQAPDALPVELPA